MSSNDHATGVRNQHAKAAMTGAYVAIAGIVIFTISVYLDWATNDGDDSGFSGYEADSLIPFQAFLGLGFAVALLYAGKRADRGQHRGLSLASMAVGIAVTLQTLGWIFDVPGAAERQSELSADLGTWVGLVGAILWAVGSGLLAKEPEGSTEHDRVHADSDARV